MDETVQIEIVGLIGEVVQKQPGAALLGQEMLQSNDLPAVSQRITRAA
ncbi:hypothetical protein [Bradyrhizobium sp. DASA03120]